MKLRPRFSVRMLAIFVTLVCAYFGAWEATKRFGVPAIERLRNRLGHERDFIRCNSPVPFVVKWEADDPFDDTPPSVLYLWLFGPTIKLPFESEWKNS